MSTINTTPAGHGFAQAILLAAGLSVCTAALALDAQTLKDIEARYQAERAACESGSTGQEREACLQEAINARAAAKHGELESAASDYERNAVARCDALPPEERDLCRRRARGEGEVKGSVEGGGILREYREVTLPSVTPQEPQAPQMQTAPQNGAVQQDRK